MLRFKDHTWLNIGDLEPIDGELVEHTDRSATFRGRVVFCGAGVAWQVRVAVPTDGGAGFEITTSFSPVAELIEVLEGLSTFETPYEYDGSEHIQTFLCQQPMYRLQSGEVINGSGWVHPHWYYGRAGKVHLTYPSSSPLMVQKLHNADGSNVRYTTVIGNWDVCGVHDLFGQPTRKLRDTPEDRLFSHPAQTSKPGLRGFKFLVGAMNWNNSLHKDPNWLIEPGRGANQQLLVDFSSAPRAQRWDAHLAEAWERMNAIHFPNEGVVAAHEVHKSRGASWVNAATWLTDQFAKEEGCPGFFFPPPEGNGTCVYGPGTRPGSVSKGVKIFAAQWTGPSAYLGHVWDRPQLLASAKRLEDIAVLDKDHPPEQVWTIGPTPMYCAILRKAAVSGVSDAMHEKVIDYTRRRTKIILDPPADAKRGDAGIFAWDAFLNLLAADQFDRAACESAAKSLLEKVLHKLDTEHWQFNCAAEGDLVGAGNARPFGHAIAAAACLMAYKRFGEAKYRDAAERLGNILLATHFITWNESPAPDLDTRGWCHGSTGGRDQWAQIPPWETGFAIQQFAPLILEGFSRDGFFDVMWLFSKTGLAQFPIARTLKRLYRQDMSIEYRSIDAIATERELYLKLPYLAYENPWDQTMLAGYQGVEPLILSLLLGGGLVKAVDERVGAFVPEAAVYDLNVRSKFTAILWNPTRKSIETRLHVTAASIRQRSMRVGGAVAGVVTPAAPNTAPLVVPPRTATRVTIEVLDQ